MFSTEEWRPIPGFPRHEASSEGRIRNAETHRVKKPYIHQGYPQYQLWLDGRYVTRRAHTLVMLAFFGARPDGMPDTRHLDGDKLNNAITNLRYGTRAENAQDTLRHGHHNLAHRTACNYGHEFTPENTGYEREGRKRYCRTCRRARTKKFMQDFRKKAALLEPPEHGKSSSYTNWACRCDECRKAHTAAQRSRA